MRVFIDRLRNRRSRQPLGLPTAAAALHWGKFFGAVAAITAVTWLLACYSGMTIILLTLCALILACAFVLNCIVLGRHFYALDGKRFASEMGGVGTIVGAVVGGLAMGVLNTGLSILAVDAAWQMAIKGFVLLLAVAFDIWNKKHSGK